MLATAALIPCKFTTKHKKFPLLHPAKIKREVRYILNFSHPSAFSSIPVLKDIANYIRAHPTKGKITTNSHYASSGCHSFVKQPTYKHAYLCFFLLDFIS